MADDEPLAAARRPPRIVNLSQKVAVNTALLVASRIIAAAAGLAGVAIATRYLGPREFGQLTVAIVFVSVFGFAVDLGVYTVVARELAKHPEDRDRLLANTFAIGLLLTAGAVVLTLLIMLVAYGGAGRNLIRLGIVILSVQMLFSAAGGTAAVQLVAEQRAGPGALAATVASVVVVAGLLLVIQLDLGFPGVAAAFSVSGVVGILVPVAAIGRVNPRRNRDPELRRRILRWAVPQGAVILFSVIYFRVDTFLLSFLASDAEVARYGVAYRVLEVLASFPLFVMGTLYPEIARQSPNSVRLNEIVQGAFSSMALAVVPLVIVFAGFSEDIIAVAGGPRYLTAAPVLRMLTVAVALVFVNAVFFHSLVALNRQRNLFLVLVAVLVANVAMNAALIPAYGAMGASISLVASELMALVLVLRIYAHVGTLPRVARPLRLVAAGAGTAAVVLTLRALLPVARPEEGLGSSFTAALGPLATLVGATVITLGMWFGLLTLLRAVPPELRAALRALRHRAPQPRSSSPHR